MAIRLWQGAVKQTTTGFRGPLMVQSLTSAKSKFLSLSLFLFSLLCLSGCGGGGTSGGVSSSYAGQYDGQLTVTIVDGGGVYDDSVGARVTVGVDGEVNLALPGTTSEGTCSDINASEKISSNQVTGSGTFTCSTPGLGTCTGPWDGKFVFSSSAVSLTFEALYICDFMPTFRVRVTGFLPKTAGYDYLDDYVRL